MKKDDKFSKYLGWILILAAGLLLVLSLQSLISGEAKCVLEMVCAVLIGFHGNIIRLQPAESQETSRFMYIVSIPLNIRVVLGLIDFIDFIGGILLILNTSEWWWIFRIPAWILGTILVFVGGLWFLHQISLSKIDVG